MSELSPSIEEKLQRIRELDAEKERLSREIESEYYTTERLNAFWEQYRTMTRAEIVPLLVGAAHDENFARCYRFCLANRLFAFGEMPAIKQPPMPVDEAKGPAPKIDYESRKAAADRIRDEAIAKASEDRGEVLPDDEGNASLRKERLDKAAAETAEFEQRSAAAKKITDDLAIRGSHNESRDHAPVVEATRDEILARIANENAELEKRRAEAKRIESDHLADAEERRLKVEAPASLQRMARPALPATPVASQVAPKI